MREIKFRAWDRVKKKMIDIFDSEKQKDWFLPSWKENYEVMQCTGLKDKNGIEIYEGDIVKKEDGWNWIVEWHEGTLMYTSIIINKEDMTAMKRQPLSLEVDGWRVVGNIYENPELMDKED